MKIAVDIDGVIADWNKAFLKLSNVMFGLNDKSENITQWELWECEDIELTQEKFSAAFSAFNQQRLWQSIKPYSGAVETMCALDCFGHELYYITARPKGSERATAKFLLKNGFPLGRGLIFSEPEQKAEISSGLKIDLAIDDKQSTICEYYDAGISTILMNQPYNWNLSWETQEKAEFIVDNIEDCVKILNRPSERIYHV